MNVPCSIIHVNQKVDKNQKLISWWTDKQNVVQPYNGILFWSKK